MILKKFKSIQISCDGGAATGKSTGAKMISKKYKLKFLSSGLLYRYASYLVLKNKPNNKIKFLRKKFNKLDYKKLNKINLHSPEISEHSAFIAKVAGVRKILKKFQITNSLIILDKSSKEKIEKSMRNIPNIKVTDINHFSAFDIIKFKKIVFTESSVKELEKRYV